jgi:phospholipid/cholesterol/gamma-HCH transport system substrate-binding protein
MRLSRRIKIQLAVFAAVALVTATIMIFNYMRLPEMFGVGYYTVKVELPEAAGLYKNGNVTYRGTEVGRVDDVRLTRGGVEAVLSLKSDVSIPSDLDARVDSVSAIGEQYVALLPRDGTSRPLRNGDVIPVQRTSVAPDVNTLLDETNTALQAIPNNNLKTLIDESSTALGGLGPELSRIVKGSTTLATDAKASLDPMTALIDQSQPVLDSQTDTSDAVSAWAAHLAAITTQLQTHNSAVASVLDRGGPAANEVRTLLQRVQPTLPILLANLVSVDQVALTYQPNIEQLLVLLPQGTAIMQAALVPAVGTKQSYKGGNLSFNLNINVPPPCTTGFLPVQQQRTANFEDYPARPTGNLYCRVPQDSPLNVRGMRNIPCETVPGKRAPTVKMCESNEPYVPLNDGFNWKGDPNATLSGQDVPQADPGSPPPPQAPGAPPAPPPPPALPSPAPPLIGAAGYDPATGTYVGPDGHIYTQSDLAHDARPRTWQSMLLPEP